MIGRKLLPLKSTHLVDEPSTKRRKRWMQKGSEPQSFSMSTTCDRCDRINQPQHKKFQLEEYEKWEGASVFGSTTASNHNKMFDHDVYLSDLTYSLCSIRNLDVKLSSHEYVRSVSAHMLVPDIACEGDYTSPKSHPHQYFDIWGKDLADEITESGCSKLPQSNSLPKSSVIYCQLTQVRFHEEKRNATKRVSDRLRKKWEEREFEIQQTMKRTGEIECFHRFNGDKVADKVTELANEIADMKWQLNKSELRTLLQNSAAIVRGRIEAELVSEESQDHCPPAEGWFCFMMVVWNRLRDLVTEPGDEAARFRACVKEGTINEPAFYTW